MQKVQVSECNNVQLQPIVSHLARVAARFCDQQGANLIQVIHHYAIQQPTHTGADQSQWIAVGNDESVAAAGDAASYSNCACRTSWPRELKAYHQPGSARAHPHSAYPLPGMSGCPRPTWRAAFYRRLGKKVAAAGGLLLLPGLMATLLAPAAIGCPTS